MRVLHWFCKVVLTSRLVQPTYTFFFKFAFSNFQVNFSIFHVKKINIKYLKKSDWFIKWHDWIDFRRVQSVGIRIRNPAYYRMSRNIIYPAWYVGRVPTPSCPSPCRMSPALGYIINTSTRPGSPIIVLSAEFLSTYRTVGTYKIEKSAGLVF